MANLSQRMDEDLKAAMKAGDAFKTSVLRMVSATVHNREIQLQKKEDGLSDEEVVEVLRGEVKKRNDASEEFKKGGRDDMALKEKKEAEMLSVYLPPEISEEELERILQNGIREAAAESEKDFGKVMKIVMPILKGKAYGDRISNALKRLLSN